MAKAARNNKPKDETTKGIEALTQPSETTIEDNNAELKALGIVPPVQEIEVFTEQHTEQKSEQEEETVITEAPPAEVEEVFAEASNEEKILEYLKDKEGEVELNDFLKTLNDLSLKGLRNLLTDMQRNGKIKIRSNAHMELGAGYYDNDAKLHHKGLEQVKIATE